MILDSNCKEYLYYVNSIGVKKSEYATIAEIMTELRLPYGDVIGITRSLADFHYILLAASSKDIETKSNARFNVDDATSDTLVYLSPSGKKQVDK